jgi:Arylsulfotransferase (ASST)
MERGWTMRRQGRAKVPVPHLIVLSLVALLPLLAPSGAEAKVAFKTDPAISPAFSPGIHDYTARCDGSTVGVSAPSAPHGSVSVDGRVIRSSRSRSVAVSANQAFTVSLKRRGEISRYHVRCLPPDFPAWNFDRLRRPKHHFYVVTVRNYVVIFDRAGVPVWWHRSSSGVLDGKVLRDGRVAYNVSTTDIGGNGPLQSSGYRIRSLGGKVDRVVQAVGGSTDIHDLQRLPNGDFLLISYQPREHVDLSAYGGSADATVLDDVIEQIDRRGRLVWRWDSTDHVGLDETPSRWWDFNFMSDLTDIDHLNSVEPAGKHALIISMRQTDSVYKIDKRTGNVIWKLGGTRTSKSLEVRDDPYGDYPLGGQHDARQLSDGTITVHDNDTDLGRAPRAVRYRIDRAAGTATLVQQITDPEVPSSFCCGSARRYGDGSWLISWGSQPLVTEFSRRGRRTFRLHAGSYRAVAAPGEALRIHAIRRGMTHQYGRPPSY